MPVIHLLCIGNRQLASHFSTLSLHAPRRDKDFQLVLDIIDTLPSVLVTVRHGVDRNRHRHTPVDACESDSGPSIDPAREVATEKLLTHVDGPSLQ